VFADDNAEVRPVAVFGVTFTVTSARSLEELEQAFSENFDGILSQTDGRLLITVYKEGSCGHVVAKALALELESALDVNVDSIDQDLVDIPEVARRTARTRQNIQQLVTGVRGSDDFPTPLGAPGGKRIWDWATVNEWFRTHQGIGDDETWLSRADVAIVDAWLAERKSVSLIEVRPGASTLDAAAALWLVYTSNPRQPESHGQRAEKGRPYEVKAGATSSYRESIVREAYIARSSS
jgi:hypothetical protein